MSYLSQNGFYSSQTSESVRGPGEPKVTTSSKGVRAERAPVGSVLCFWAFSSQTRFLTRDVWTCQITLRHLKVQGRSLIHIAFISFVPTTFALSHVCVGVSVCVSF